jgi:hypothetical protein
LYQSGKLKEERRIELEKIGLKWAVLSTTSWHSMYEALCKYVQARKIIDKNNIWDGHVPANYETNEKPPKRLGRWVTRQRTAYSNKKLKNEYREKLEKVGLSWEPNETKPMSHSYLAHVQKRQEEKRSLPVVVVQRPMPQIVAARQLKPNIPPVSTLPPKNIPPVASLKPATPAVATLKPPTIVNKQPSLVNNK